MAKEHKLIDYFDKAIPHYNIAIRDVDSDSELFFGEMRDIKDCSYRNFTVLECGINSSHYEDIDCLVFYIDLDEDAFVENKKYATKSLKEKKVNYDLVDYEVGCMLNRLGVKSWDFSNEENCKRIEELNDIVFDLVNILPKL